MSSLPPLPANTQRANDLKRQNLIEKYGFTGDQYGWSQTWEHLRVVIRNNPGLAKFDLNRTKAQQEEDSRRLHEEVGIEETLNFGNERYKELAEAYIPFWLEKSGHTEDFESWLVHIQSLVENEARQFWADQEKFREWFDRICYGRLNSELLSVKKEYLSFVRNLEIQHLQNPGISLQALYRAKGDLKIGRVLQTSEEVLQRARIQLGPEQKREILDTQENVQKISPQGRQTRTADMVRHQEIADIVSQYDPEWITGSSQWRRDELLSQICRALDDSTVPVPAAWTSPQKSGHGEIISTWMESFEVGNRKLTKETINASLKAVKQSRPSAKDQSI